jgi:hypothetical protein
LPVPPLLEPDVLERALGYPYARPRGSFRYWPAVDHVEPLVRLDRGELEERTVVLAIGSNASPEQLRRKYGVHPSGERPVAVLPARVSDHDVVYGALVAGYGSVPATLVERPGTTCHVHVTLLDDAQLERMHETEGIGRAYELVQIDPALVAVDLLGRVERVEAYVAIAGPMLVGAEPVALATIAAEGRSVLAWHQHQVLTHLAARSGTTLAELVARVTADDEARRDAAELLRGP